MNKKVKWNKSGAYEFVGFCLHADTDEQFLLYRTGRGNIFATPFKADDYFTLAGRPRNRMFDLIEE
jgi:hypothetical protein